MIENDDGGPSCTGIRVPVPPSLFRPWIETSNQSRDEGAERYHGSWSETQESVADRACSFWCRSWIFVSPIEGLVSSASTSRRKCTWPKPSPATIVRFAAIHAVTVTSTVNVRISFPSFKSQTRSVLSSEPEDHEATIGRHRHGVDAARMAFERAERPAALQVPEPQHEVAANLPSR